MTDPADFTKLVPGLDFLQGLVKNAGAAMPSMGQWVAPTLDPKELDKRIQDLRTVQFWLEQNARSLGMTIQALEVQRMTLTTLETMNVSLGDLTDSLKIRMPEAAPAPARAPAPAPAPVPAPAAAPAADPASSARKPAEAGAAEPPVVPAGVADPMQWWNALTQQFRDIAAKAVGEVGAAAAAAPRPRAAKSAGKGTGMAAARGSTVGAKGGKAASGSASKASGKPADRRR